VNKRTREIAEQAARNNQTPLHYMLSVVADPTADVDRRDRMAIAAAPFCHPRISTTIVEARVETRMSPQEQQRLLDAVGRLDDILNGRAIDMVPMVPALPNGNGHG
jgi:hypothetical protein